MSLLSARILVTRSAPGWEVLARRANDRGGHVDFREATRSVAPSDLAAVRAAALAIETFSWIVLTSARGAFALAAALQESSRGLAPTALRAACVGPATERAACEHGLTPVLTSTQGRGADLAESLSERLTPGERVLVVRPEIGSAFPLEPLSRAGADVTSVAFYATQPALDAAAIATDLESGRYDVIVVTAPSAIAAISPSALRGVRRIALGATTADALATAGVPSDAIAARPDVAAVADALDSLC